MSCTQSLFDSHTTKMEILESRISDQDAEIERLYDEFDSMANDELEAACEIRSLKAEIERLKTTADKLRVELRGVYGDNVAARDTFMRQIRDLEARLAAAVEPGSDDATGITEIIRTYQSLVVSLPLMDADLARFGDEILDKLRGES